MRRHLSLEVYWEAILALEQQEGCHNVQVDEGSISININWMNTNECGIIYNWFRKAEQLVRRMSSRVKVSGRLEERLRCEGGPLPPASHSQ